MQPLPWVTTGSPCARPHQYALRPNHENTHVNHQQQSAFHQAFNASAGPSRAETPVMLGRYSFSPAQTTNEGLLPNDFDAAASVSAAEHLLLLPPGLEVQGQNAQGMESRIRLFQPASDEGYNFADTFHGDVIRLSDHDVSAKDESTGRRDGRCLDTTDQAIMECLLPDGWENLKTDSTSTSPLEKDHRQSSPRIFRRNIRVATPPWHDGNDHYHNEAFRFVIAKMRADPTTKLYTKDAVCDAIFEGWNVWNERNGGRIGLLNFKCNEGGEMWMRLDPEEGQEFVKSFFSTHVL